MPHVSQSINLTSSTLNNDNFYREDKLIKQASAFTTLHTDVGPLNNMFTNKLMIKNKINKFKFPEAYDRDGNDLMRP